MKLRIKGDSVRYRLSKTDMKQLEETGAVIDSTDFGLTMLHYRLQQSPAVTELSADFYEETITIHIPAGWAAEWIATERVGFDSRQQLGNGKELYLLVEKDFKCLDETHEDQSDNYDNPLLPRLD